MIGGFAMTMHFLLTSAGATLGAIALFFLSGLGEIELDNSVECNGYLSQPQTTDVQPERDYAALTRADERVGLS
jgi:hypothetical protein